MFQERTPNTVKYNSNSRWSKITLDLSKNQIYLHQFSQKQDTIQIKWHTA
jgi:hypothetical protein